MPTYLLTQWVRDRTRGPRIELVDAVRRLTSRVEVGLRADLNVIDVEGLRLEMPRPVAVLPAASSAAPDPLVLAARVNGGLALYAAGRPRGDHRTVPAAKGVRKLAFFAARTVEDEQMVLEHALLDLRPGEEEAFEAAFAEATPLISAAGGFRSLRLEDHTEGFRGSPAYATWKALLHHFCDPFPLVAHFQAVLAV